MHPDTGRAVSPGELSRRVRGKGSRTALRSYCQQAKDKGCTYYSARNLHGKPWWGSGNVLTGPTAAPSGTFLGSPGPMRNQERRRTAHAGEAPLSQGPCTSSPPEPPQARGGGDAGRVRGADDGWGPGGRGRGHGGGASGQRGCVFGPRRPRHGGREGRAGRRAPGAEGAAREGTVSRRRATAVEKTMSRTGEEVGVGHGAVVSGSRAPGRQRGGRAGGWGRRPGAAAPRGGGPVRAPGRPRPHLR